MVFERAVSPDLAARLFAPGSPRALALLRTAWPLAVGPGLARRTELLALEGVTLRVRVPDARWRKVLHRLQPLILGRLRAITGAVAPRRMGFDEGPVADRGPVEAPPPPDVALRCPDSVAAGAAVIADTDLRARFVETAARYLSSSKAVS
jgi:hypothetical protein